MDVFPAGPACPGPRRPRLAVVIPVRDGGRDLERCLRGLRDWSLTDFELMILLAILRTGEDAYGVRIAEEIERTGGRSVVMGAIYTALDRLERNGLVSSFVGDPTPERGGRAKRFFEVTPRGLRAVKDTQKALVALWTDLPQLKERRT